MQDQKQEIIAILKKANNVLVTVKKDPSVDQLSAALGLTLALNKLGKHAAAVYSGQTPSTIEFLEPDSTFEKTTDSLRDFIISLDKAKADKLKYKVEDDVVKIFITPYRASISQEDLEFSQGDFNVEAVVALGVKEQTDLDEAIRAHGRIFHDAKVITINDTEGADLGGISWVETGASGVAELTADVARELGDDVLDEQVATAFLTGIVASTDRFSNERTSANTMKTSAVLMAAGANQQLVATKLTVAMPEPEVAPTVNDDTPDDDATPDAVTTDDGSLKITHDGLEHSEPTPQPEVKPEVVPEISELPKDDAPADLPLPEAPAPEEPVLPPSPTPGPAPESRTFVGTPGGEDAHLRQEDSEPASTLEYEAVPSEPTSMGASTAASSKKVIQPLSQSAAPAANPADQKQYVPQSLEDIERAVHSRHLDQAPPAPAASQPANHSELDLSMLQTPSGLPADTGAPLPMPQQPNPNAAPPVPPPIIPPAP